MSIKFGLNPYHESEIAHHTPSGFKNPEHFAIPLSNSAIWMFQRMMKRLPHHPKQGYKAFAQKWWQAADFGGRKNKMWWLGHATTLIRIQGLMIITDPMFSRYASPFQFIGTKRILPPAATIDELPLIDVIANSMIITTISIITVFDNLSSILPG